MPLARPGLCRNAWSRRATESMASRSGWEKRLMQAGLGARLAVRRRPPWRVRREPRAIARSSDGGLLVGDRLHSGLQFAADDLRLVAIADPRHHGYRHCNAVSQNP